MNRLLLLPALLVFAACSQQSSRPPARLSGTSVVAVTGELAFVASTDRHELLVIDGITQDFVRAPNPLELLSIPVVDTPTDIARDLVFTGNGKDSTQSTGQYVYAWSRGGTAISAVGAARESLREEYRLDHRVPITAVAARVSGGNSQLFYATHAADELGGPSGAAIFVADVPAPTGERKPIEARQRLGKFMPGIAITSLAILPDEFKNQVIVVTRASAGVASDVLLLDLDGSYAPISLRAGTGGCAAQDTKPFAICGFSTAVRDVKVDARVLTRLRVFGILDESSCADSSCSGIEAVDVEFDAFKPKLAATATAQPALVYRAEDNSKFPMKKIDSTGGYFTSLDLTRGAANCAPGVECEAKVKWDKVDTFIGFLGLTTQANGDILIIEGDELRRVDVDQSGPTASITERRATGNLPMPPAPTVTLGDGAAVSETIEVTYAGTLVTKGPGPYTVTPEEKAKIVPNDQLVLRSDTKPECNGKVLNITGVTAAGAIETAEPSIPDCAFEVRAGVGTAQPFTVTGSVTGFMGRVGQGGSLEFPPVLAGDPAGTVNSRLARYDHRSNLVSRNEADYNASQVPPMFAMTMPPADPNQPAEQQLLLPGDAYILGIDPHIRMLDARVNTAIYTSYFVPLAVARSEATDRTYVVYPAASSGPAILGMRLSEFENGGFKIEPPYQ